LRHRRGPIAAVIDPDHAQGSLAEITGIDRSVPIVRDLAAAMTLSPCSRRGGLGSFRWSVCPTRCDGMPWPRCRPGYSLASGLHTQLGEDPEFKAACHARAMDLGFTPGAPQRAGGSGSRCLHSPVKRVLAVGTDMAVGKMSACLALQAAAERHKLVCRFVGTGQAGILISGRGVPLDAVRVDYAAGAVEAAVLEAGYGVVRAGFVGGGRARVALSPRLDVPRFP